MNEVGKTLVIIGICMVVLGLIFWSGVGRNWFGKLPGDIQLTRGNLSFYFPLATCLLISLVLTVLLWLFRR
jgi:hypothetical protein